MTRFQPQANDPVLQKSPSSSDGIYRMIRAKMGDVEKNLQSWSQSSNPLISEVARYIFQEKGKRLRPALLLLSAKLSGYKGKEDAFLAALIEMIHTASLIHDDIIDNASMRRGKESVHTKWGPNITVLLGDYLFIKSVSLSLGLSRRRLIHILADLSARMIEGELMEYAHSGDLEITEPQYMELIAKKTASQFAAACQIGAVLGRASAEKETRMKKIGHNLGLSFQIIDDLLDFIGDEKSLGKPTFSDVAEGRITLPLIHALRGNGGSGGRWLESSLEQKNLDAKAKRGILELLRKSNSLKYAYSMAEKLSTEACELLGPLAASPCGEAIQEISRFILDREK